VALCRQVHDRIRLVLGKDTCQLSGITNIYALKGITIAIGDVNKRFQITGVSQFINIHNGILGIFNNMSDDRRADETRSASNKDFHAINSVNSIRKGVFYARLCETG